MLATLHGTGGYVVGRDGKLHEWGSGLARTQAVATELGDAGTGFRPFEGLRDANGQCPRSPLVGSVCMCVHASTNLAVAVTASGSAFVWGTHHQVHTRRYPPSPQNPAPGNGALNVTPNVPWEYQQLAPDSLREMQPTEAVLPAWCHPFGSESERILYAVAGSMEVAMVTGSGKLLIYRSPHVRKVEGFRVNAGDVLADTAANCVRDPDARRAPRKLNPMWELRWHPLQPGHCVANVGMGRTHGALVTKNGDVYSWGDSADGATGVNPYPYNAMEVDKHGVPVQGMLKKMKAPVLLQRVWNHVANSSWFVDGHGTAVPIIEVRCSGADM